MKLKKLIALSTLAVGFGALVSFAPANRVEVRAEEETTQVVEEIKEKQNKFIDETLVPLVIALVGSNTGALIGAIIFYVIKHKKEIAKQASLTSIIAMIGETIKKLNETQTKTEEMMKIFENSYENTLNLVEGEQKVLASYKDDLAVILELKNIMICMAQAQLEQIKSEPDNIKNGLSHEITELQERLKALQ